MTNFKCLNHLEWKTLKNNKSNIMYAILDLNPFDIVTIYINKQYNGKYSCHLNCKNDKNRNFWKFKINDNLMSVRMNVNTFNEAKNIIINRLDELLLELRYDKYKKIEGE